MNTLYYGDNLKILRDHIKDASVEWIYLGPAAKHSIRMKIDSYIQSISKRYALGNATEHTFRGDLQQLIESLVPDGFGN